MKTKLLVLCVSLFFTAATSKGAVGIDWYNSDGIYLPDGITLAPNTTGFTLQLILAAGSTINYDLASFLPGAGETLISLVGDWSGGEAYDNGAFYASTSNGSIGPGTGPIGPVGLGSYLYAVIFNSSTFEYAILADGSGNATSAVLVEDVTLNPAAQASINTSLGLLNFDTLGGTMQVVPEPSVLAFLGLGGLALAARRRFVA